MLPCHWSRNKSQSHPCWITLLKSCHSLNICSELLENKAANNEVFSPVLKKCKVFTLRMRNNEMTVVIASVGKTLLMCVTCWAEFISTQIRWFYFIYLFCSWKFRGTIIFSLNVLKCCSCISNEYKWMPTQPCQELLSARVKGELRGYLGTKLAFENFSCTHGKAMVWSEAGSLLRIQTSFSQ